MHQLFHFIRLHKAQIFPTALDLVIAPLHLLALVYA